MRTLNTGKEGAVAQCLEVHVIDEPGVGGGCHQYQIVVTPPEGLPIVTDLHFQEGAVNEAGINGITNEALLAIVIDRLQGFSKGPYASRETSLALTKCQEAVHWLEHRTRERASRGVEGLHQK